MAVDPKSAGSDPSPTSDVDADVLKEARERFDYAMAYESVARKRAKEDQRFYYGDSDNRYQWPDNVRQARDVSNSPTLTVNMARQFVLNIVNDARQNKSAIKVDPVGDRATYEGAQVMGGIIQHIEAASKAQDAYDLAILPQVQMGRGYWRLNTRYESPMSMNQEIIIEPIPDPFAVLLDPDTRQKDKSDMRWAFVFEDVPRADFELRYPGIPAPSNAGMDANLRGWSDKEHVRVAEYYRRRPVEYQLVSLVDPQTGEVRSFRDDQVAPEIWDKLLENPTARTRKSETFEVEWYKIAGDQIVDRRTAATGDLWLGSTIPIVAIIGEESIIDGQYDVRGHLRYLKDPNRIYNYWTSAAVEQVALNTKAPWTGSVRAVQGHEAYWRTANTKNWSFLPYNDVDSNGNPIQPPQRVAPPTMAPAYIQGMQIAQMEVRMASGQWEEDQGMQTNAVSGVAVNARVRQSNLSTQHFVENLSVGLAYTGRMLVELIPQIYDTRRIVRIMGEDGEKYEVLIDPDAAGEIQQAAQRAEARARLIFNPGFGKYAIQIQAGPDFATRRQQAFSSLAQIMQGNPTLLQAAGDLLFRAADFPLADELSARLRRMVPPYVLGQGPSPQEMQQAQEVQMLRQSLAEMMQKVAERDLDVQDGIAKHAIEEFRAETERLKVLLGALNEAQQKLMADRAVRDVQQTRLPNVPAGTGNSALEPTPSSQPPIPGQMPAPIQNGLAELNNDGGNPLPTGGPPGVSA